MDIKSDMLKLKGKYCYLCGNIIISNAEGDRDHIPPRNIFPTNISGNLITVPTHKSCNNCFSNSDEIFRAYLTSCCYENARAKEVHQTKVRKSLDGYVGNKKRQYLASKSRNKVRTDDGELIKGPLLLIENDDVALIPQFQRIVKGLYYHKLQMPLSSTASIEIYFKDINEFENIGFKPTWENVEKDVFRYFLFTQQGDDSIGIAGLVFYEKVFCLVFFS